MSRRKTQTLRQAAASAQRRWPEGVPMKSILDRSFHYTPSVATDLRKTFARIREERSQIEHDTSGAQAATESSANVVVPMRLLQEAER